MESFPRKWTVPTFAPEAVFTGCKVFAKAATAWVKVCREDTTLVLTRKFAPTKAMGEPFE